MRKLAAGLAFVLLFGTSLFAQTNNSITVQEILRADYGSGGRWVEVTDRVRSMIQNNSLRFRVNGNSLGSVSTSGSSRVLRLQVRDANGRNQQITFRDNSSVRLQINGDGGSLSSRLQITHAEYGAGGRFTDVTSRLNSQVQNGQLHMQVNNDTMGGDPARNSAKTLRVEYTYGGRPLQVIVNENSQLILPNTYNSSDAYNNSGRLQINRAQYGTNSQYADVTSRLSSQVQNDQLNIRVNNDTMGGDPARSSTKTLRVNYTYDGRTNEILLNENDQLNLPGNHNGGGTYGNNGNYNNSSNYNNSRELQIDRAEYGANNRYADVTDRLKSQVQNGRLYMRVNDNTMGSDPAQGAAKTLRVQYTYGGRSQQVIVNQYDQLDLPGSNATSSTGSNWGNVTIPSGTQIAIRTNEVIDSSTASQDQKYSAVITKDVLDSSGAIRIPSGSDAQLVILNSSAEGTTSGSDVALDLDQVTVLGRRYVVSTADLDQKGGRDGIGANKRTATMVGGGAAIGAIIGAIVGGGKGAAIGAGIGAAGGAGTQVLTKGKQVKVPAETVLTFMLDQDLNLKAAR
jgi:hypothetical protein